jgi:hypothetical protein
MSPNTYPAPVYQALYTDEEGKLIGLDEVQLLDPVPSSRIPDLLPLLAADDLYLAYQAGLVLAAWGIEPGVAYLRHLVAIRIDKTAELAPSRLTGEDNVYDIIGEALGLAVLSGYDEDEITSNLTSVLGLYGECFFEGKLKSMLLQLTLPGLLPTVKQAVKLALEHRRYYQASQLLPVLAMYDRPYALSQAGLFEGLIAQDTRIAYNLAEMREHA